MSGATHDAVVSLGLVAAFATLVCLHVATVFGLARRRRAGRALGALLVPPLAPYWAITYGMRVRGIAWIASAALYGAALVMAR